MTGARPVQRNRLGLRIRADDWFDRGLRRDSRRSIISSVRVWPCGRASKRGGIPSQRSPLGRFLTLQNGKNSAPSRPPLSCRTSPPHGGRSSCHQCLADLATSPIGETPLPADLPPCGGDGRQARGGQRRASTDEHHARWTKSSIFHRLSPATQVSFPRFQALGAIRQRNFHPPPFRLSHNPRIALTGTWCAPGIREGDGAGPVAWRKRGWKFSSEARARFAAPPHRQRPPRGPRRSGKTTGGALGRRHIIT